MLTNDTMRKLNELKLFGMARGFDNHLNPWPPLSRLAGCPHSAVKWVLN